MGFPYFNWYFLNVNPLFNIEKMDLESKAIFSCCLMFKTFVLLMHLNMKKWHKNKGRQNHANKREDFLIFVYEFSWISLLVFFNKTNFSPQIFTCVIVFVEQICMFHLYELIGKHHFIIINPHLFFYFRYWFVKLDKKEHYRK